MVSVTYSTDGTTMQTYTYSASSLDMDTDALIDAAVYAKMQPAYNLETKITTAETKITSYTELQSLLTDLQDAGDALRNSSAISDIDSNVFLARTAYLTSSDGVDAGNYLDVTVDSDTETGNYSLVIDQIAEAHKISGSSVSDSSAEMGYTGSFTLGLDDGDSATISVTSDMSLDEIATAINAEADTTGVKASVVQVDSSTYTMVLTAQDTGKEIETSSTSGTDIMNSLGFTDSSGDFSNVLNEAQDAIIEVDGLTITRDSNEIDDVLDGVTFNLYAATAGATVDVEIAENVSDIKTAISDFVDAYNAFREFVATNQATSTDGSASDDAVLFGDYYLRSANSTMSSLLSTGHGGYSLRDFGITLNSSNELELDEDTLNEALLNNLDGVQSFFAFEMTSSSDDLGIIASPLASGDTTFTLDLTVDSNGDLSTASVGGDSSLFTVKGSRIVGAEGTIYEGMTLVYTGDTTQSITVTLSQGMADQLYHQMDNYADSSDGSLADAISTLDDQIDSWGDDIDNITTRAEKYRTTLEAKYTAMQTAYETAQILLDQLEANSNASNDD
ncbi:flagellar filament capping protein FliD [Insolitispirillum peregrinum]|uniref:Flagellar hook-associated protein 2 n=1 Tax=Insolitispirillum peregrinum TaxID=80876 RepID=A0A1N7KFG4_9PROT|nr:flagellar filament capping protein FliD [Insolitispirillum peregrinum]SIS60346.1 flagellar hook-associated protein 2 [Insolitispirillum peregrinum]